MFDKVPVRRTRGGKVVWDGFHLDNPTLSYLSDGRQAWTEVIEKILNAGSVTLDVPPGSTRREYAKRLQVMLHSHPRVKGFSWSTKPSGKSAILVSLVAEFKSCGREKREATAIARYLRGDSYREIAAAVCMSRAWVKWLIRVRHLTGQQGRDAAVAVA